MSIGIIIVLVVAGLGAGIVTGLAGASAATVVTPLLVSFTPIAAYTAVAISLITDVFASFFSFLTYRKAGNINIKDGIILTITACIGAAFGSYISSFIDSRALGSIGGIMTLVLGIKFLLNGLKVRKEFEKAKNDKDYVIPEKKQFKINGNPNVVSGIIGIFLGIICGVVGAGGGLMILFVLTSVLNYDTKTAIGTSVLIMTFTALTGGVSHFLHMEPINMITLFIGMAITSFSAVIGAKFSAKFANESTEDTLLIIVGAIFIVISVLMILRKVL
ncbi:MAG: sulfite exporter TauE/SafE family protein [Anaerorhabdus sp.]